LFIKVVRERGQSLVVTIPIELANHLKIVQEQKVKLYQISNEWLMMNLFFAE